LEVIHKFHRGYEYEEKTYIFIPYKSVGVDLGTRPRWCTR